VTGPADLTLSETVERAEQLLLDERDAENLKFVEDAIERFPQDPEVRLLYGTALVPFRPEEAPWQLATAIKLDMDNPWRLTRAACLLFDLGEVEASRSYAARAVQFAPDKFSLEAVLTNLGGRLAALQGDDALAEEALRAAVESEPLRASYARDLARFLADQERPAEALDVIDRALRLTSTTSYPRDYGDRQRLLQLRGEIVPDK